MKTDYTLGRLYTILITLSCLLYIRGPEMVLIYNGVTCRTDERVKREESPRPPRVMDYALKSYHLADFSPSSYSPPDLLRLLLPPSSSSQSSSMLIFWSASYLFCSRCKWDYIFVVAVGGRECVGWVCMCACVLFVFCGSCVRSHA